MRPDLDEWLPSPALKVAHTGHSEVGASELWDAARALPLAATGRLGRLVRWRIPGLARDVTADELFRQPPFQVLDEGEHALISGLVGRIWTLRRDYPQLRSPDDFRHWDRHGTVRVVFANWAQEDPKGGSTLSVEVRVQPLGRRGRLGLSAVRPLVRSFQPLVSSEGITAAVRAAERRGGNVSSP